jgi:hypothetical protein
MDQESRFVASHINPLSDRQRSFGWNSHQSRGKLYDGLGIGIKPSLLVRPSKDGKIGTGIDLPS